MVVGFVILSHQNPAQLARLVRTLNRLYDCPPIACHHDFSQTPLDTGMFPNNVVFAQPSLRTGWGKFSVVEAALLAFGLLRDTADPDWFVLMSAADYPIATASQVRNDLAACRADALIDYREPGSGSEEATSRFGPGNPALGHFEAPGNRKMLPRRYFGAQCWLPIARQTPAGFRLGRHTIALPFSSPFHPFGADYRCYYGDHWFTASRKAVAALLDPSPQDLRVAKHLHWRASADECYYQSVLCNRPELRLDRDNRRYAQWNGGGAHPATLGCDDLEAMLASGAHFARKFRHDDPVLDRIDERLNEVA